MTNSKPVIVIGGGWAGLTTAVELVRHGVPAILCESAKQLGGRARRIPYAANSNTLQTDDELLDLSEPVADKTSVDNGQHLLTGAYQSTLNALQTVGVKEESVFSRQNLAFNIKRAKGSDFSIRPGRLPAPLHLVWGLLFAKGISLHDRYRALQFCVALQQTHFSIPEDITCLELFRQFRQTNNIIKLLWEPLCIAALNTPMAMASAKIFLRVLQESFTYSRRESDLLFTRVDLGRVYPDHAMDFIEKKGGTIRLGQRALELVITYEHNHPRLQGVRLQDGKIECQHVVLATSHSAALKLLKPHTVFANLTHQLDLLGSQPIVTVYLQYPETVALASAMVGFVDSTSQWVFDRGIYGQRGLMAVVISSSGPHMAMNNDELANTVQHELAGFFPYWPKPLHRMIIREKRATFDCVRNCDQYRPGNSTALEGVWLAGDYTDTQLPATLESAVRSGQQCAQSILKSIQ